MPAVTTILAAAALAAWLGVWLLPWQPQRTRERLEANPAADDDLRDVTVLIPARDEAAVIGRTVAALKRQGRGLAVVVVDDQSSDGTAAAARDAAADAPGEPLDLTVVAGAPLPAGWAGKLWALEQGLAAVDRRQVLLLDADIELAPRMLPTLKAFAAANEAGLVSIMAQLGGLTFWERLLAPAFVFFFKLIYPFALANAPGRRTAAAAGGCMFVRVERLRAIGGFAAVRHALIDDCTLAAALKAAGSKTWIGLSHSVASLRAYDLSSFWRMVSRSAFTQLDYSAVALLGVTLAMFVVLLLPPVTVAAAVWLPAPAVCLGALAWIAMSAAYRPVVAFYRLPAPWALSLPLAAALFVAMTWSSAFGYWRGTRATWKNRSYGASV